MAIPAKSQSVGWRRNPIGSLTARQRKWMPYVFVAPFFIAFGIFKLYPVLHSVVMGFQETVMFTNEWTWVGLDNYIEILTRDVRFGVAMRNFLVYSFFSIITQIPVAFFLALMLASSHLRGRSIFRAAYFLPSILPGVTIGEGSIVGARSVVASDVPPYTVAAGNPARVIRQLPGSLEDRHPLKSILKS